MPLILHHLQVNRTGNWGPEDYAVLDGETYVGRIYRIEARAAGERWFWGLSEQMQLDGRKRYGCDAPSRDAAMAALRSCYDASRTGRAGRCQINWRTRRDFG